MEEKDLPKRKPTRWSGFDYSRGGAYFLTLCMQDRKKILSTVERTEKPVGDDVTRTPKPTKERFGEPLSSASRRYD